MERIKNEYILEKYEPMTKKYWQRNKKPNINLLECPFATDRQLEDQKYLIEQNKVNFSYFFLFLSIFSYLFY